MYQLLIVDDEQIVTDSVQFMVKKYIHTPMRTETAHSGREAIEKAVDCRPDFVVIDIKMPGINGLDAIREIKNLYTGALFIVISAFAKFDYAKEAIQLGVIEYLNKPLSRKNLVPALENAVRLKEQEQSKLKAELDYREKIAYARPALENSLIHYITFPDDHTAEIESLQKILDLHGDGGYVMTVLLGSGKDAAGILRSEDTVLRTYPALREAFQECSAGSVVGPVAVNRVTVYLACAMDAEPSGDIAPAVYEKLRALGTDLKFRIGVGRRYPSRKDLHKSYEESVRAADFEPKEGVARVGDIPAGTEPSRHYPHAAEKDLLKKTSCGETDAALAAFETLFGWFSERYTGLDGLKSALIRLVVILFGIPDSRGVESDSPADSRYIQEFLSLRDVSSVRVWMESAIRRIGGSMEGTQSRKLSPVIRIAADYIAQNYNRNITLENVSEAVNVSPTYFSKMFKDEVGSTFIDYVTMLRIRQAKNLIAEGKLSNKEISDVVGYSDPNYFSRVFKKTVGATPTEYRTSLSEK